MQQPRRHYGHFVSHKSQIKPHGNAHQSKSNIQFVRPRDEDEPDENPVVYEINETVVGGSSHAIEFMPTRAMPLWAEATRKALLTCAEPPGRSPGNDQKVQ